MMIDDNMKRMIIMEHYQHPLNHGLVEDETYKMVHNQSDSCIDDLTVQMKIENGIIKDIRFDGVGCTISTSTTSIMSNLIKGKSREEGLNIIENYLHMIFEEEYDEDMLEELIAFEGVSKQANRIKCATIGINAMKELIENE